jgi:putative transposase
MYRWRKITQEEQAGLLEWRKKREHPWHRPPHAAHTEGCFHITAACYEHGPFVGATLDRMREFSEVLLETLTTNSNEVHAWCLLPNHYHLLVHLSDLGQCLHALGRLHGRTSHAWNGADAARGRKVWSPPADRAMRSEGHFWATVNYVHHNPVRHGYVERWQDWPFSSAHAFLDAVGREEAEALWRTHPLKDYGAGWDDAEM